MTNHLVNYFLETFIRSAPKNGLPCVRSERSIFWIPDLLLVFGVFLALSGAKNFAPPTKKQKWSSLHHEIRQFQKTHTINDPLQHINQRATQQLTRRCTFWTAEWSLLGIFGWKITRIWVFWGGKNAQFLYLFSLDGGWRGGIKTQQSANTWR